MIKPIPFSPAVLQSERTLEKFLFGKETIEAVKAQAKLPYSRSVAQLDTIEVTWLALTTPLRFIYALFVKATATLLSNIDHHDSQWLFAHATLQQEHALRWCAAVVHGKNLLVSTLNAPAQNTDDVYAHPPIPLSQIPKVQDRFHYYQNGSYVVFEPRGMCFGESEFYAHLYFQTRKVFRNEEQHLVAIAKLFSDGAPRESVLWQHAQFQNVEKPLLGLKKRHVISLTSPTTKKIQNVFGRLKPGFYSLRYDIGNGTHRIHLIPGKMGYYVFNADKGLIDTSSQEEQKTFSDELTQCRRLSVFQMDQRYQA